MSGTNISCDNDANMDEVSDYFVFYVEEHIYYNK